MNIKLEHLIHESMIELWRVSGVMIGPVELESESDCKTCTITYLYKQKEYKEKGISFDSIDNAIQSCCDRLWNTLDVMLIDRSKLNDIEKILDFIHSLGFQIALTSDARLVADSWHMVAKLHVIGGCEVVFTGSSTQTDAEYRPTIEKCYSRIGRWVDILLASFNMADIILDYIREEN